jgi:hypothetical protein
MVHSFNGSSFKRFNSDDSIQTIRFRRFDLDDLSLWHPPMQGVTEVNMA